MKKPVITALFAVAVLAVASAAVPVIPLPQSVVERDGVLVIGKNLKIEYPERLAKEASFLSEQLVAAELGSSPSRTVSHETSHRRRAAAGLVIDPALTVPGSYILKVTPDGIEIAGADNAGVFYGIVTLLQLIEAQGSHLACVEIGDAPRFGWRGFMLDEARHFFGQQKVFQILDLMARFKLNKFHWHLSDSEGWRIEIKAWPRLAETGGRGSWSAPEAGEPQYYTQQQIREIVEYAAARHIEVIPEIDMPGHANAAVRAYPELSGGVSERYGEFTFNPGRELTYKFLTDVLREVTALFPSQYMHIGGDEVSFGIESWNTDPETQALIRREGFSTLRQVEKYFIDRMSGVVRGLGKKLIGWDELVEIDAPASTTILWWRHNKPEVLREALGEGYRTVLCPRVPCYLDFIQNADHKWGRIWTGDFCTLDNMYSFPDDLIGGMELPAAAVENITGLQANLWTERVPYGQRLDFMIWPRLCTLSESAWTAASRKDLESFKARMEHAYNMFDRLGIYYYDYRDPLHHPEVPGLERGEAPRGKPVELID